MLEQIQTVMPDLVPGIHVLAVSATKDVDGRDKPGHDGKTLVDNVRQYRPRPFELLERRTALTEWQRSTT
jgi:hypothetical protein